MKHVSRFWHVVLYDESQCAVACACFSTLRADPTVMAAGRLKLAVQRLRQIWPRLFFVNVLFNGLPISAGQSHLVIARDADSDAILRVLDGVANDLARRVGATCIVYKQFGHDDRPTMDFLSTLGYRRADSLPMFFFTRDVDNFAQYLWALRHDYRQQIKRSRRRFVHAGYRVVQFDGRAPIDELYTPDVHRLYESAVDRSTYKLERLPREFFLGLAREFRDAARFSLTRRGEQTVAFTATLHSADEYHFLFCGREYSLEKADEVYFNIVYGELERALASGHSRIALGQTAGSFKLRLGCEARPLYSYVKVLPPLLGMVFQAGCKLVLPPGNIPAPRDVFRQRGRPTRAPV